jgi:solute carrier family 25 protein 33/36
MPGASSVVYYFRFIYVKEGIAGLFKGLGPNLMGVFPSRAIYFWAYSTAKRNVNASLPKTNRDTPFVHVTSAGMAGN